MTTSTKDVTAKAELVELLSAQNLAISGIKAAFKVTYPKVQPEHEEDREREYAAS